MKKCPVCQSTKISEGIVNRELVFACKKCGYLNKNQGTNLKSSCKFSSLPS